MAQSWKLMCQISRSPQSTRVPQSHRILQRIKSTFVEILMKLRPICLFYEFNIRLEISGECRMRYRVLLFRNIKRWLKCDMEERVRRSLIIEHLTELFWILNAYSKVPPKPKVSSTKRCSEFEELEAVPSLSVMEGPLEPPTSSTVTSVSDVADDSFCEFLQFEKVLAAMNIGIAPNTVIPEQTHQSSAAVSITI
ncbi:hypothetical protein J5N97_022579 [Dioscorea zingiberensis]|uniref:Uncharacterized protein n=1 Tax=Dioscorea zingiberensis TaxID=325984 RepID=A0A9D5CBV3_9LILI|nr:hypothetical protein J5N97_022579 [Dioscorea zingiberensis]